ncbi:MAG: hypothetical protein PHQ34_04350 [Methanothrix sp.]|nr:hypothetical protein [Methanothrix sp.]
MHRAIQWSFHPMMLLAWRKPELLRLLPLALLLEPRLELLPFS